MAKIIKPGMTYVVLSAIGNDRSGHTHTLSKVAQDNQCNILDSRMVVLGGQYSLLMKVEGTKQHTSNFTKAALSEAETLGLQATVKTASCHLSQADSVPYKVNVISMDHGGIVQDVARFFTVQNMNIQDLVTGTYAAPHTGTPMFDLTMIVEIPPNREVTSLRDEFIIFCDEKNLDARIDEMIID